jgi:hypothetical protein
VITDADLAHHLRREQQERDRAMSAADVGSAKTHRALAKHHSLLAKNAQISLAHQGCRARSQGKTHGEEP